VPGIGRIGRLAKPLPTTELAALLKKHVPTQAVQIVGDPAASIERVAVCVGAAGSLPFSLGLGAADCLITGEIRHHDALAIERLGFHALALGHWASERPVLARLAAILRARLPDTPIAISEADRDPFKISV
jgi:putative NIF3 family GTP cyclohydrolase 1 type 2